MVADSRWEIPAIAVPEYLRALQQIGDPAAQAKHDLLCDEIAQTIRGELARQATGLRNAAAVAVLVADRGEPVAPTYSRIVCAFGD